MVDTDDTQWMMDDRRRTTPGVWHKLTNCGMIYSNIKSNKNWIYDIQTAYISSTDISSLLSRTAKIEYKLKRSQKKVNYVQLFFANNV